jgi:hypothetical protein
VHLTLGSLRKSQAVFYALSFFWLDDFAVPAPAQVTQTVETVEKVPFQILIFEKWVRNIEKRIVFCVLKNILAIFEPGVGDFCENFSNKGFFDSLVGRRSAKQCILIYGE